MHKWYVVQVLSTHENKVQKALLEQIEHKGMNDFIERVLVPTENVSEVKQGQQRIVEKRIWPGYILIKMLMTDDSWQYVKTTAGVIDFLGGDKPTALSDREVDEILRDLEQKQKSVTQKHKFKVGDTVKIVDGVFVNFTGTITEVFHDKGRLSVNVSIFGRETQVDDLEFNQVEEVQDNAEKSD
ncbi:transcription termination/antitermination protein NusG [Criblamydia sequanensis]|uniref:Transcription termination/antitermination protein NusG n=1 Tax=Candidatus Criblamydia sequanensis CRIB-18 TaxID=1437425 RepID=A0A090CZ40_9BACT|nr:transcription termination/antitermination protein NusG [Criblamydia sequanensis]CDR33981.1 Transcription antitermination protein nusG [Criblamydia sequanensis CRIB-18]